MREEEAALLLGLDPLGERLEAEVPRQLDDRGGEHRRARVVLEAGDEGAVDLEHAHPHLVEPAERGVAGAEVVDRQAQAALVQLGEDELHVPPRVEDERRLGELDHQPVGVEAEGLDRREHVPHRGRLPERRRQVDGDVEVEAVVAPGRRLAAGLAESPSR